MTYCTLDTAGAAGRAHQVVPLQDDHLGEVIRQHAGGGQARHARPDDDRPASASPGRPALGPGFARHRVTVRGHGGRDSGRCGGHGHPAGPAQAGARRAAGRKTGGRGASELPGDAAGRRRRPGGPGAQLAGHHGSRQGVGEGSRGGGRGGGKCGGERAMAEPGFRTELWWSGGGGAAVRPRTKALGPRARSVQPFLTFPISLRIFTDSVPDKYGPQAKRGWAGTPSLLCRGVGPARYAEVGCQGGNI